jgi:hypothetical protein
MLNVSRMEQLLEHPQLLLSRVRPDVVVNTGPIGVERHLLGIDFGQELAEIPPQEQRVVFRDRSPSLDGAKPTCWSGESPPPLTTQCKCG